MSRARFESTTAASDINNCSFRYQQLQFQISSITFSYINRRFLKQKKSPVQVLPLYLNKEYRTGGFFFCLQFVNQSVTTISLLLFITIAHL